jgi:hypothetical protein
VTSAHQKTQPALRSALDSMVITGATLVDRVGKALTMLSERIGSSARTPGIVLLHIDEAHYLRHDDDLGLGIPAVMSAMARLAHLPRHMAVLTSPDSELLYLSSSTGWPPSIGVPFFKRSIRTKIPALPQAFTSLSFDIFKLKAAPYAGQHRRDSLADPREDGHSDRPHRAATAAFGIAFPTASASLMQAVAAARIYRSRDHAITLFASRLSHSASRDAEQAGRAESCHDDGDA